MDDAVEPRKQTGCHGSAASRHKTNQMSSTFRQSFDTWAKCTNIRLMLSVEMKSKKISHLGKARTISRRDDVVFRFRNSGKQQTYVGYS